MAERKTPKKTAEKKQEQAAPALSVRIDRMVDYENSSVRAIASANIGGAFAIHGIKVINSQKGLFVSMPQSSYQDRDGNTKYSDIFHPITTEARTGLKDAVLDAYEAKLAEVQEQDGPEEGETQGMGPTM